MSFDRLRDCCGTKLLSAQFIVIVIIILFHDTRCK